MSSPADQPASTTSSTERPEPAKPRHKPQLLPPWRVLLHNDDENTIEHVVSSIVMLTPLNEKEAVRRTLEAHETGVTLLLTTHQERAELYRDQFACVGLTVTIEPSEG